MPHYREDEKYWDMQKTPLPRALSAWHFIYRYTHTLLHKKVKKPCSVLVGHADTKQKESAWSQIHLLTAHVNMHHRSDLIFISSCNQTFRLQGSLGQRKKLPKATQLSLISRRKGCELNGRKASGVNYLSPFESFSSSLTGQPMTNRLVRPCHPAFKLLFS